MTSSPIRAFILFEAACKIWFSSCKPSNLTVMKRDAREMHHQFLCHVEGVRVVWHTNTEHKETNHCNNLVEFVWSLSLTCASAPSEESIGVYPSCHRFHSNQMKLDLGALKRLQRLNRHRSRFLHYCHFIFI